jgi:hypothetical protein
VPGENLAERLAPLTAFMGAAPLTTAIAGLERGLDGCGKSDVARLLQAQGVSADLLRAAFVARAEFGRINDVIHAAAIALALPQLLEEGEVLKKPSLAAGNDPSRPYDVETNRRAAEFKLSRWDGHDAGRKRQLFKDVVHLAAADIGDRRAELYVLGDRPKRFLTTTRSTAGWALNRIADNTRDLFEARFGSIDISIPSFVEGAAAHVEIVDLELVLPDLFALDSAAPSDGGAS